MTRFDTITAQHWRKSIARSRSYINPVSAQIRSQLMQATSAKVPDTADRSGRGAACANQRHGSARMGVRVAADYRTVSPLSPLSASVARRVQIAQ